MLRSRIAPTPSGYLHLGNAYSFILTALLTKLEKGTLHLRIDDIDSERSRPEFIDDIFSQIDWLGIRPDSGPSSTDDFYDHFSQLKKLDHYLSFLKRSDHNFYACSCSRAQVQENNQSGIYPGTCREKALKKDDLNFPLRARVKNNEIVFNDQNMGSIKISLPETMGDFIVRRKGGLPSYQLVSVIDDFNDKINFIVRGEDLLTSTAAQIYLAQIFELGQSIGTRWFHHPLLLDMNNKKLSKSHKSLSLREMRSQGVTSREIYRYISKILGHETQSCEKFEDLLDINIQLKLETRKVSL